MRMVKLAWIALVVGALAAGCGDGNGNGGGPDGDVLGDGAPNGDGGDDGGTLGPDGGTFDECQFTDPDGVPSFDATFVESGAGTPPDGTGGDPTGTWIFDTVTFYLDPSTSMMVDASSSSATGTAWAQFEGDALQIKYDASLELQTTDGPVSRMATLEFGGTYTASGGMLTLEESCRTGNVEISDLQYTVSGSDVLLRVEDPNGLVVVFEGTLSS